MNIVIVEDELPAAEQMRRFVASYRLPLLVTGVYSTCAEILQYLDGNDQVDLVFCDIELRDGNALQALQKIELKSVIVFTTAYDRFWSESMQHNGIDYLLKPLTEIKVHAALDKVATLKRILTKDNELLLQLSTLLQQNKPGFEYKKRFPVRVNNEVFIIDVGEVQFFRIAAGTIFAYLAGNKKYPIVEETLSALETQLDPALFFRINRSDILHIHSIRSIKIREGGDYTVLLKDNTDQLVVSSSRIVQMKEWLK